MDGLCFPQLGTWAGNSQHWSTVRLNCRPQGHAITSLGCSSCYCHSTTLFALFFPHEKPAHSSSTVQAVKQPQGSSGRCSPAPLCCKAIAWSLCGVMNNIKPNSSPTWGTAARGYFPFQFPASCGFLLISLHKVPQAPFLLHSL